jgi:hypothetical protein
MIEFVPEPRPQNLDREIEEARKEIADLQERIKQMISKRKKLRETPVETPSKNSSGLSSN